MLYYRLLKSVLVVSQSIYLHNFFVNISIFCRRYSSFSASRELPFDLDDALLLWVNKTNAAVNARLTKDQDKTMIDDKLLGGRERMKKVGLRPEENVKSMVFPEIHDLLEGLWDGRALLGVLLFYEPNVVNIESESIFLVFSFF